jgi:hypothetical protein
MARCFICQKNEARKHGRQCNTCITNRYRKNNILRASFNTLKSNSKRRGKAFSLTFKQFCKFAVETDYITGKGRTAKSLTIDRKDESKGYTIDNIQILPNSANIKKYLEYKYNHDKHEMQANLIISKIPIYDDVPF